VASLLDSILHGFKPQETPGEFARMVCAITGGKDVRV
jgi:hypothetical protein